MYPAECPVFDWPYATRGPHNDTAVQVVDFCHEKRWLGLVGVVCSSGDQAGAWWWELSPLNESAVELLEAICQEFGVL